MDRVTVKAYRWLNAVAFLCMLVLNGLANALSLGGVRTGDISDKYPNLFTPSAPTFAIWGVIYLLLAGFTLYQTGWRKRVSARADELVAQVAGWFALSCVLNMAWLICWHFDLIGLSVLMIFALLAVLILMTARVRDMSATWVEKVLVQAPFHFYLGWITVAAIANMSLWLTKLGWDGWGLSPQAWTVVLLVFGTILSLAAVLKNGDWVFGLAVKWGYAGILARHALDSGLAMTYPSVVVAAAVAEVALLAADAWAFVQWRKRRASVP